jgi:hypothetical protein
MTTQIVMDNDSPRARMSDPTESHAAADKSAETRAKVRGCVLWLVEEARGLTGSEINALYVDWRDMLGWPTTHYDSPRKRAGELHADGLLRCSSVPRGTEREYVLP